MRAEHICRIEAESEVIQDPSQQEYKNESSLGRLCGISRGYMDRVNRTDHTKRAATNYPSGTNRNILTSKKQYPSIIIISPRRDYLANKKKKKKVNADSEKRFR